jgi:dolichol-phosphate mannosyltransferase
MDRKAYEALRNMPESNRFIRAMSAWVGFKSIGIDLDRPPRFGGSSKANTFKVLDLAIKGILAFSNVPLRLASFLGIFSLSFSILALPIIFAIALNSGYEFKMIDVLFSLFVLLFAALIVILGIIGEYVGLIYEEVKIRPKFIVEELIGF